MNARRLAWLGFGGLAATVGGCQLVSGLSGYQDSGGTATGTAAGTGGAMSSSSNGSSTASAGGSATTSSSTATTSGSATSTGNGGNGGAGGGTGTGGAMSSSGSGSGCGLGETLCDMGVGCVDLSNNPAHCGSCTRSCMAVNGAAGSCVQNACVPVPLSEAYPLNVPVTAVAADPAAPGVYWAVSKGSGELHAIPKDGTEHVVGPTGKVGGLATHNSFVYFTATQPQMGLYEWDIPAGAVKQRATDPALDDVGAVVTGDAENVIWGGYKAPPATFTWPVYWTQLAGMTAAGPYADDAAAILVADDTRAYWPYSNSHFERLVASTGATEAFIAVSFVHPDYLAADGDPGTTGYLYGISTGQLFRVPKNNGGMQTAVLETDVTIGTPKGLAVTPKGNAIYWLEDSFGGSANGKVMRLDSWNQGQQATIMVDGLIHPANLAIDDKHVYYVSQATLIDKTRLLYGISR